MGYSEHFFRRGLEHRRSYHGGSHRGQISTVHTPDGYVPTVSFLGTHFENLRIAGEPVEFRLDLNVLGEKPEGDIPYLSEPQALGRIQQQNSSLSSNRDVPAAALIRYADNPRSTEDGEVIEFSLIQRLSSGFTGSSYGHIVSVPGFGTIQLAIAKVSQAYHGGASAPATTVDLTMVEVQMDDDLDNGPIIVAPAKTNGGGRDRRERAVQIGNFFTR